MAATPSISMEKLTTDDPEETKRSKMFIYKNLTVVSLGFLLLFTAFQALQNLQSSIHQDAELGLASLCIIYAALVISCMFVPPLLINRLGCKYTIMLAMTGYVTFTLANFYPRYWTLLPTSFLLGTSGAPLWAAKCSYVTTSGIRFGQITGESEDNIITRFFGIFFLIFQTGQIWGNLISSLVLKPQSGISNVTFDVAELCGANFCPSTKIADVNQKVAQSTVWMLMGIYVACGIAAVLVIFFFLDKITIIGSDSRKNGFCDLFIATFKHMKDRKMQLLIPLTIFSGLEQGFVFADFTKAFATCALGIEKVGFIMIVFGAVDAVFSLSLGKIVQYTGRPAMMITGAVVNMALLIVFLLWKPDSSTLYVFFLGAAFWGFSDAIWQTQVNAFYGVLFPTNQEAAFSNYRLWESLGFVISFAYSNHLCVDVKLYILMVVLVIGIALYVIIEMMQKKEAQSFTVDAREGGMDDKA